MSTKTTFKRIALVAVAALGFGVLSVVPSQAAAGTISLAVTNGKASLTPATGTGETTTGALITVSSLLTAGTNDSITVQFIATGTNPTGSAVRPVMTFIDSTTAANTALNASANGATAVTKYTAAESVTAGLDYIVRPVTGTGAQIVGASFRLTLDSATASTRVAGTYNYLVIAQGYSNGVLNTALQQTLPVTIVIDAAVVTKVVPAAASAKSYIQAMATYPTIPVFADSVTAGSFVAGTVVGTIRTSNFSATDVAARDTFTVTMTGNGYLRTVAPAAAVTGRSFTIIDTETLTLEVVADGASGTGSVTIKTAAGASFVKTVTFFDTKPSKAVATVQKAFIKAGTGSVADVFGVVVTDVLGNAIKNTGATVTAAPTDTATTVGGAATCAWDATVDMYECAVTGKAADKFGPVAYTITATGTGDNILAKVTTTATVTFADNVATKAVLAGPATTTPGATVEYTLTLTEKNGYPVADQAYGVNPAGASALFASAVTSGWTTAPFSTSESFTSVSGVLTSKGVVGIAGTATGTWTLVGDGLQTLSTSAIDKVIGKTKVTASTEITNPGVDAATDAANEATDAANAATDAALAAAEAADAATTAAQEASDAVAALSETVTKLISDLQAQIKSLAAVVAKIAKKVKA